MSQPHFVLSTLPTWSHIRTLCVLASKVASARPITVTIVVANILTIVDKVSAEVTRCLESEGPPQGEVRIVAVGPHSTNRVDILKVDPLSFEPTWKALIAGSPVRCSSTGLEHSAAARPSLVILDGSQLPWLITIRSMDSPPPVLHWTMGFSGGVFRFAAPESKGGKGDYLRALTDADLNDPECKEQETRGDVIHVAGMPPMYDWEFVPQVLGPLKRFFIGVEATISKFIDAADGMASACAVEYDGEGCLSAMSTWMSEIDNRPTFHLGPMLPFVPGSCEFSKSSLDAEVASTPNGMGAQILQFLDRARSRYGECSVVYISFGTLFWPSNMGHLCALLYSLERKGFPFIFTHAAFQAQIPDDLKAHFENSEMGLFSAWSPQQAILAHKACGWFITHGGAGGTMEALSQGVPMIGWPFTTDQPNNIAHLVHNLDVAFEFIEVRTGELGLRPIFKTGKTPSGTIEAFERELEEILDDMKGEVGTRKRANAKRARDRLAGAWGSDGVAKKAFEKFLDRYGKQ